MFENLLRELERMKGRHEIRVSLPSDEEGYLDRRCASQECLCESKVHEDDWRDKVRDEQVFCAFCGYTASSGEWWTDEQREHAERTALAQFERRLGAAMKRDAQAWNRRQTNNGFIRISMRIDDKPGILLLPLGAAEPMRIRISCPACACRYAVIGAAFFCPACGHNAADLILHQTIAGIRNGLQSVSSIRAAIPDSDAAETAVRMFVESGLQNAVTAFQRYAEALHAKFPAQPRPRRNVFQNLAEGSALWKAATGKPYDFYLDPASARN